MRQLKEETIRTIINKLGEDAVFQDEPMAKHTSMEVGGPAAFLFQPSSEDDLLFLMKVLGEEKYPYYIKGNGSNLIFQDEGFDGAVIEIEEASLTGFEFASGIPGSLGGAVCMNAGAYDGEMKDIIRSVRVMSREGDILEKNCEEMAFSYRKSLCSSGDYIVLSATLQLAKGNREDIRAKIADLTARREEKQPLEFPSCGSVFKRPEGYFAGKLISDAGLKGYRIGGAQVSEKHAGFIINTGGAKAQDVLDLIAYVQKEVQEKFGVNLECEVKIL